MYQQISKQYPINSKCFPYHRHLQVEYDEKRICKLNWRKEFYWNFECITLFISIYSTKGFFTIFIYGRNLFLVFKKSIARFHQTTTRCHYSLGLETKYSLLSFSLISSITISITY